MHLANRRGHLLDAANLFDHEIVRQKSLIDQLHHAFIVRLTPDGPKMFAANFHNLRLTSCSTSYDINSHRHRPGDILPAGALPEFSAAEIVVGHQDNSAHDANPA